jgi:hypothetical protein
MSLRVRWCDPDRDGVGEDTAERGRDGLGEVTRVRVVEELLAEKVLAGRSIERTESALGGRVEGDACRVRRLRVGKEGDRG